MWDVPPYQGAATIAASVRTVAKFGRPKLAAVDRERAYRAFPVRRPEECATVLPGGYPKPVYLHQVLPFGSAASVWSYVRFADAACCISVATLFVGAAHFVDDFFECEAEQSADHDFQCFQAQHRVFGTKMKEVNPKPPSSHQSLLGVDWEISDAELLASPGAKRISKVRQIIGRVLVEDRLHPSEAAKLAGKLNFICSWVFSHVGKALLGPLFKRQSSGVHQPSGLSQQLRTCLQEIHALLPELRPVRIPLQPEQVPVFVLYADAFITLSGTRRSANRWLSESIPKDVLHNSSNGWGAVFVAPQGFRQAFRSEVPAQVLRRTATSKAFIFWLEMLAQLFAILAVLPHVRGHLLCFVDNSAAQHALTKGYSKDASFTKVLGCFSRFLAAEGVALSFHRVTSSANVSDSVSRDDWSLAVELG